LLCVAYMILFEQYRFVKRLLLGGRVFGWGKRSRK